jgi:hypothetical protein
MEIQAIEVLNASTKDLVTGAVLDNTKRQSYDAITKIRASLVLHNNGVEDKRAASALGCSLQTYKRSLLVAQHACIFDHVEKNHIGPTHAASIIQAAKDVDRVDEVCQYLGGWVSTKEQEIQRKVKDRKDKGLKDLSPAQKQVKTYVTGALVKHWETLITENKHLDDKVTTGLRAGYDPETGELVIGGYKTKFSKESAKSLAMIAAKADYIRGVSLALAVKKRTEEEQAGATENPAPGSSFSVDCLRQAGLDAIADELEEELSQEPTDVDEDAPEGDDMEERGEEDSSGSIRLPMSVPGAVGANQAGTIVAAAPEGENPDIRTPSNAGPDREAIETSHPL